MELSVRDWMLIVGVLLFVAVVLDGLRRMRAEQRESLRLGTRDNRDRSEDDKDRNPELPGGGARLVERRDKPVRRKALDNLEPITPAAVAGRKQLPSSEKEASSAAHTDDGQAQSKAKAGPPGKKPATAQTTEKAPDLNATNGDSAAEEAAAKPKPEPLVARPEDRAVPAAKQRPVAPPKAPVAASQEKPPGIQELIIINVIAPEAEEFPGAELLEILLACDCRMGSMNIFHRYESPEGKGEPQFSVVNIVEPGTFDLDNMGGFSTPGIGFFMNLPGPEDPMKAFECLIETARCVTKHLGGELRDEMHSVATTQTLEHFRQRISDFERKQLTLV